MSYHPEWASRSPFPAHPALPATLEFERKLALVAILLLIGGVGLSLLNFWPPTANRLIWEAVVFLTPARFIYATEYAMVKNKWLPGDEPTFRPEHFGNHQAKAEALQRVLRLDDGRFTTTFRRVRALSRMDKMISGTQASHPAGLGNWDNSCYQNSVLQGLASLSAFRVFISCNMEWMNEQDEKSSHEALKDITEKLNATENYAGTLWTPSALKSMDSWQQQDAQEYFSKLMDTVDRELSKSMKRRRVKSGLGRAAWTGRWPDTESLPLPNPLEGLLAQRVACRQCGHTEGLSLLPFNCLTINMGRQYEYDLEELLDEHTALENIEGVECIKCTLLHTESQLERLLLKAATSDNLDESTDASKIKVIAQTRLSAIQKVFEDDSFSESGILKRCNISAKNQISSTKSKQVALARPPKNLVIHINRSIFDELGTQRKNTAAVRFPPAFDVGRWCLGVKSSSADIKDFERWSMTSTESMLPLSEKQKLDVPTFYELRCVLTHYGRHENGHYVAYGKRRSSLSQTDPDSGKIKAVNEQWYCFNDEMVRAVSEDEVLERGNVFMLFYEASKPPRTSENLDDRVEQKVVNMQIEKPLVNDVERKEEPGAIAVSTEKPREESVYNILEEGGDGISSIQQLGNAHRHIESEVPQSCEASETAPISVTDSPPTDSVTPGSGLTPVMRTSSVSPTLSRMERRKSSFPISSSTIISAV